MFIHHQPNLCTYFKKSNLPDYFRQFDKIFKPKMQIKFCEKQKLKFSTYFRINNKAKLIKNHRNNK